MSKALRMGNEFITYSLKTGLKKGEVEKRLKIISKYIAQGDFAPRYWDKKRFYGPDIYFDMQEKIDLSLGNLKKLDAIAKRRNLQLLYDRIRDKAIIKSKRRVVPLSKTIMEVCGSGKIIVKKPNYVVDSQEGLLEEIGEVFELKA